MSLALHSGVLLLVKLVFVVIWVILLLVNLLSVRIVAVLATL